MLFRINLKINNYNYADIQLRRINFVLRLRHNEWLGVAILNVSAKESARIFTLGNSPISHIAPYR